jgi:hypothetical protein
MAKGGARARSGPAKDPNALRRERDKSEWRDLPKSGRTGRVPAWPLTKATPRERTHWNRLWKMPQAIVWEEQQQHLQVAIYVRRLVESESRGSKVNLGTLVKQLGEDLGLSLTGMARHQWRIVEDPQSAKAAPARKASARDRLRVVDGGLG